MSKEPETEVTVNDRRMFNPDGTLRQPIQAESEPAATPPPAKEAAAEKRESEATRAQPRGSGVSQDFSNLVGMLTTNAILHLGADPQFGKGEVDIETARHFIDMLTVLQEKTEGNLTAEEQQLLTDMIGRLRMEYVAVVNQMSKSAKKRV
jgi:hypothetical protein